MRFIPSTLAQREEFYSKEFDIEKAKKWFSSNGIDFPQVFAVDMGGETGIIKDESKKGKIINIRGENLREKFIRYLPEDAYYDRNRYKDREKILDSLDFNSVWKSDNFLGQQLAFDIDPENFSKEKKKFPGFDEEDMLKAVKESVELYEKLKERFSNLGIAYSGRGMHVHVFDKESFSLGVKEREELNKELKKFHKFHIDPWVSRGYIRLMRLPFSLNGLVSRIVLPLSLKEAEKFNPITDKIAVPKFLR